MKKIKSGLENKATKDRLRIFGFFLVVIGITVGYSAFYIVTNNNDNADNKTSIFKQGATTLLDNCAGVCNQVPSKNGDIVIAYNGDIMVSGAGQWDGNDFPKTKDKNVSIPAGQYTVKLESYDHFVGRKDNPVSEQSQEQYYVVFKDGNSELARTGTTKDLKDGVEEDGHITFTNKENNAITLTKDVDKITIVHAGPTSQSLKHGFEPVCMLLEKIEAGPECGDGHKDSGEECDDGNTKDGDGCSSNCTVEKAGPECGDGHKDSGEECDDGNTKNGDGCSSACKTEKKEKKESCDASIGNYIWYDTNGNGVQEDIEEGIEGIKVCAYNGNNRECDTTNKSGKYKIKDLCEHTYEVVVKNTKGLIQTFDPDGKKDNKTKVKLKDGDKYTKADFGYRGAAPATGLTTNIALLIGISTLITIGILMVMKKKGAL